MNWLKHLFGQAKNRPVGTTSQRFYDIFQMHGVEPSQIPRLLPQVKLSDLQSPERLLEVLSPELLDQVAKMFGVRVAWLEGVDDKIYEYLATYKDPARILKHMNSLLTDEDSKWDQPIRVLCTKKQLDRHNDEVQLIAPVLVEKIAELGDEPIYRYHIYQDGFPWDHPPARIELKALARTIVKKLRITVPLYEVERHAMDELLEGRYIPSFLRHVCFISNPSLEDYALTQSESGVAKETDELPDVLRYINEQGLDDFCFASLEAEISSPNEVQPPANASKGDETVRANASKAAHRKHAQTNEIKQRFVTHFRNHASEYASVAEAGRAFFNTKLTPKERYAFKDEANAIRAFRGALKDAHPSSSE